MLILFLSSHKYRTTRVYCIPTKYVHLSLQKVVELTRHLLAQKRIIRLERLIKRIFSFIFALYTYRSKKF